MKVTARHTGVFLIGLAIAFFIAERYPEDRDTTEVYLYFAVLFTLYLGISYLISGRGGGR